jgi:hypothetical protein
MTSMIGESDLQTSELIRPRLWNPNAAACWSLLFTPVFGAYLHASNWKALNKPERAETNLFWLYGMVAVYFGEIIGTMVITDSADYNEGTKLVNIGMLLIWYFTQGRSQASFVKKNLGDDYVKKGWGLPLITGAGGQLLFIVVAFGFTSFAEELTQPSANKANEIAAMVKPMILQEWQNQPKLRSATIEDVMLVHKDGNTYKGTVRATIAGKSERIILEVTHDGQNILWQLSD